jgi:UDP-sugar pyrophosphorylase
MYSKGIINKWTDAPKFDVKWLLFFQDTNGPSFRSFLSALGVSIEKNFSMNTIAVPRKAGQAIGAIAN